MNLKAQTQAFQDKALAPPRVATRQERVFAAPLGVATIGHLIFARGASRITLSADPGLSCLFQAHFEGRVPDVRVQEGRVTIRYPYLLLLNWLTYWRRKPVANVMLNSSIAWHLLFRGGVSRLTAELERMRLRSVEFGGGASRINMKLPPPTDTVSIRINGGASNVAIHRPDDVPVRIRVDGGLDKLTLDRQRFGAMGSGLDGKTDTYESVTDRYDITILGGARHITVDTWNPSTLDKTR